MCYIQTKNFLVYKTQVQMTTHASVSVTNIVLVQHKLVLTSHDIVRKHYSLLFSILNTSVLLNQHTVLVFTFYA